MSRAAIFAAVRDARGKGFTADEVPILDVVLDRLGVPKDQPAGRKVNAKGLALMREFEGCKLTAYPDPGSRDGNPWTIGYGSTGPGIHKGVTWTQQEADERHEQDVAKFAAGVDKLLGNSPTNPDQFSAMVALAYNIGLGAFAKSTLLKRHKEGNFEGAARAFGSWVFNDGKPMNGLIRRREAEAKLYRSA